MRKTRIPSSVHRVLQCIAANASSQVAVLEPAARHDAVDAVDIVVAGVVVGDACCLAQSSLNNHAVLSYSAWTKAHCPKTFSGFCTAVGAEALCVR